MAFLAVCACEDGECVHPVWLVGSTLEALVLTVWLVGSTLEVPVLTVLHAILSDNLLSERLVQFKSGYFSCRFPTGLGLSAQNWITDPEVD